MIRNRIIALYIQVDSFEEKYISSISNYVFQRGPRGYNPTKANLKKIRQACACGMHAPGGLSFFLNALRLPLKNLKNSDFGKCRGITVTSAGRSYRGDRKEFGHTGGS
jgi:hypothetical protein